MDKRGEHAQPSGRLQISHTLLGPQRPSGHLAQDQRDDTGRQTGRSSRAQSGSP